MAGRVCKSIDEHWGGRSPWKLWGRELVVHENWAVLCIVVPDLGDAVFSWRVRHGFLYCYGSVNCWRNKCCSLTRALFDCTSMLNSVVDTVYRPSAQFYNLNFKVSQQI